jgi:nicotinamidase-related amidase
MPVAVQLELEEYMTVPFIPGKTVEVPEITYQPEVSLPAASTAVIVVDMQNDFVKSGGTLTNEVADNMVPHLAALLDRARAQNVRIAYTQDSHLEGDPEWSIWPEHCRVGTWGWEIIAELKPQPDDLICPKNRYDGFYGTWLDHFLTRVWHVQNLVIVGTVANICVLHTAASAGLRWFNIVIPADGVAALTEFDQAMTLRQASWLYRSHIVKSVTDIRFAV